MDQILHKVWEKGWSCIEETLPIKNLWYQVEGRKVTVEEEEQFVLIFHDVTESYQAQMILQANLTLSNELYIFFDTNGCLLQCSKAAANVFGFLGRMDAMGVHYRTFLTGKLTSKEIDNMIEVIEHKQSYHSNVELSYLGNKVVYEWKVFNVILKEVRTGFAMVFSKQLGVFPVEQFVKEEVTYEKPISFKEYQREVPVEYKTKEYERQMEKLEQALRQFDYLEINELLERLAMIAPEEVCDILQKIQEEVMEFQYEKASALFYSIYR